MQLKYWVKHRSNNLSYNKKSKETKCKRIKYYVSDYEIKRNKMQQKET